MNDGTSRSCAAGPAARSALHRAPLARLPPAPGRPGHFADRFADAAGGGGLAAVLAQRVAACAGHARVLPHRPHHRLRARRWRRRRRDGPPAADALHPDGPGDGLRRAGGLAHAQRTTPAAIYALAFVAGAATAFDNPARQALVPRLVDREQLPNALSLYATVWQVATIAGPALGGRSEERRV